MLKMKLYELNEKLFNQSKKKEGNAPLQLNMLSVRVYNT